MVIKPADGQVHKVIRLVATSPHSWEDAARGGVQEAARTIADLHVAQVTEMDTVVDGGSIRERGSHEELMSAGGEYARRFRAQGDAQRELREGTTGHALVG